MRKTAKDYAEYIDRKYGEWTITGYAGSEPNRTALFHCRCSCGSESIKTISKLRKHNRCIHHTARTSVGKKFGRLTIISGGEFADCVCDCGAKRRVKMRHLRSGNTKSCGCLHTESTVSRNKSRRKRPPGVSEGEYESRRLTDNYCKGRICKRSILTHKDIPQSLVEAKRAQLKLMRLSKGMK